MKLLLSRFILLTLPVIWLGCKEVSSPVQPLPFLKTVIEMRYTSEDSMTVTYQYNQAGQLQQEEQRRLGRLTQRIVDLYDPKELGKLYYTNHYRSHTYNTKNQKIAVKRYFRTGSDSWLIFDSDSLLYQNNQLVRQLHYDHYFTVDGGQYSFAFPLWLTTQTRQYDGQGRVVAKIDSVFITHDIPVGSVVLTKAPTRYLHTNQTTYSYNQQGLITQTVAVSGEEAKPMFYSNGWSFLSTNGKGGYASLILQRFMAGTTKITYEYNGIGQLSAKTVSYEDGKTPQPYVSRFTYLYDTQAQ
jgi:hypothetical protein